MSPTKLKINARSYLLDAAAAPILGKVCATKLTDRCIRHEHKKIKPIKSRDEATLSGGTHIVTTILHYQMMRSSTPTSGNTSESSRDKTNKRERRY